MSSFFLSPQLALLLENWSLAYQWLIVMITEWVCPRLVFPQQRNTIMPDGFVFSLTCCYQNAAKRAIVQVALSRIMMAMPGMSMWPLLPPLGDFCIHISLPIIVIPAVIVNSLDRRGMFRVCVCVCVCVCVRLVLSWHCLVITLIKLFHYSVSHGHRLQWQ